MSCRDRGISPLQRLVYELTLVEGSNAARVAAAAREAERQALVDQLLEVERQLRTINPLPAGHPALAQEPGLLAQAEVLRAAVAGYDA